MSRFSRRLGLTEETKPERIEAELMKLLPRDEWIDFGGAVVLHGRYICKANDPQCSRCVLNDLCAKSGVTADPQLDRVLTALEDPPAKNEARPTGGASPRSRPTGKVPRWIPNSKKE